MALALNNLKRVDMPLNKETNQMTDVIQLRLVINYELIILFVAINCGVFYALKFRNCVHSMLIFFALIKGFFPTVL